MILGILGNVPGTVLAQWSWSHIITSGLALSAAWKGVDAFGGAGSEVPSASGTQDAQCPSPLGYEYWARECLKTQMIATKGGTDVQGCKDLFANNEDLMNDGIRRGRLVEEGDKTRFVLKIPDAFMGPHGKEAFLELVVACARNVPILGNTPPISAVTIFSEGTINVAPFTKLDSVQNLTIHSGWNTELLGLSEVLAAGIQVHMTGLICCQGIIEEVLGVALDRVVQVSCEVDLDRCELMPAIIA